MRAIFVPKCDAKCEEKKTPSVCVCDEAQAAQKRKRANKIRRFAYTRFNQTAFAPST